MNQRIPSKIIDYKVLEAKARWVTAKTHERITRGDFKRLSGDELGAVRASAGKVGNEKSQKRRKSNAHKRRGEIKVLLEQGVTDPHSIASRVSVNISTIYRDLKVLSNT